MIANKVRDNRRSKFLKMPKNIQRLYKEGKCRECSVVVTQMDFAKILGKFTKVKIQYESSTTTKNKKKVPNTSPNSRLKKNENGMVLLHRNAYQEHPVKGLLDSSKSKSSAPRKLISKDNNNVTTYKSNNILKENNKVKKITKGVINNETNVTYTKQYAIQFVIPEVKRTNDHQSKTSLAELLPSITKEILPSEEWCIDYFPKDEEPKDDKVYDRIAAELEDLMYKENPKEKANSVDSKPDEFPSIMDILNDNSSDKPTNNQSINSNLESSDVEAMLLGKSEESSVSGPTPMEVDNLIAGVAQPDQDKTLELGQIEANPNSPSILDEALQKGIEEQLPVNVLQTEDNIVQTSTTEDSKKNASSELKDAPPVQSKPPVTHVIFKKSVNGKCSKSVTCPKSLKYSIELQGKSVELLGAPKFISSIEDLQVLLQIVDESNLDCLYVLH